MMVPTRSLRAAFLSLSLLAAGGLSGCSLFEADTPQNNVNQDAAQYRERPIDMIYADGWRAIQRGNWALAAAQFSEMERQHP
jgi:outer membrane protein assembly factor BamD (BamD/ComL family)